MTNRRFLFGAWVPLAFVLAACGEEPEQQSSAIPAPMAQSELQISDKEPVLTREELISQAVAAVARPDADKARDAGRKPAEVMAFSGIGPGDVVADIGASGGYYTRIIAEIVGKQGHVYAFNAKEVVDSFFQDGNPSDALAAEYENISSAVSPFSTPTFDKPLDAAVIVLFYHDSHWDRLATDTALMNKTIFDQLKPGGTYFIVDHSAEDGSGLRDVGTIHRIDAAVVKQEVMDAGFEFVAESDALKNPEDDRTKSVFDPTLRGKTDRFVYKFKKPE